MCDIDPRDKKQLGVALWVKIISEVVHTLSYKLVTNKFPSTICTPLIEYFLDKLQVIVNQNVLSLLTSAINKMLCLKKVCTYSNRSYDFDNRSSVSTLHISIYEVKHSNFTQIELLRIISCRKHIFGSQCVLMSGSLPFRSLTCLHRSAGSVYKGP